MDPPSSISSNYKSACLENKVESKKQILVEIESDRYIISDTQPMIVSSLGAIVKSTGKIRLIHDFSRPSGGLNILTTDTCVKYPTIDNAVTMIKDGSFLAKVDLKSAYRSVPIHADSFNYTGLQWNFGENLCPTFLYDCRLPFGASRSCRVFQAITSA